MSKLKNKACVWIFSSFWVHLSPSLLDIPPKVGTCAFDTFCIKTPNVFAQANPHLIGFKDWTLCKQRILHEAFMRMRPLMTSLAITVYAYHVT